ncbi:MAG: hypothetical protein KKB70_05255 [Proteobacteria bacterium]|nr:hypothetical protein [Pseudomonadota bacterium]
MTENMIKSLADKLNVSALDPEQVVSLCAEMKILLLDVLEWGCWSDAFPCDLEGRARALVTPAFENVYDGLDEIELARVNALVGLLGWPEEKESRIQIVNGIGSLEGWGLFNDDCEIQHDDEAAEFDSDDDAVAFIQDKAGEDSAVHEMALELAGAS